MKKIHLNNLALRLMVALAAVAALTLIALGLRPNGPDGFVPIGFVLLVASGIGELATLAFDAEARLGS